MTSVNKAEKKWTPQEDEVLRAAVARYGTKNSWQKVSECLPGRTNKSCRKRWIHSLDPQLRKGRWTAAEDAKLINAIKEHGFQWWKVARQIDGRTDDQCAKRWREKLDPSISRRPWSAVEDKTLMDSWKEHGKKWNIISTMLPGRPAVHCRNRYQSLTRSSRNAATSSLSLTSVTDVLEKNTAVPVVTNAIGDSDHESESDFNRSSPSEILSEGPQTPLHDLLSPLTSPPLPALDDSSIIPDIDTFSCTSSSDFARPASCSEASTSVRGFSPSSIALSSENMFNHPRDNPALSELMSHFPSFDGFDPAALSEHSYDSFHRLIHAEPSPSVSFDSLLLGNAQPGHAPSRFGRGLDRGPIQPVPWPTSPYGLPNLPQCAAAHHQWSSVDHLLTPSSEMTSPFLGDIGLDSGRSSVSDVSSAPSVLPTPHELSSDPFRHLFVAEVGGPALPIDRSSFRLTCPVLHCHFQSEELIDVWRHMTLNHVTIKDGRKMLDHLMTSNLPTMVCD